MIILTTGPRALCALMSRSAASPGRQDTARAGPNGNEGARLTGPGAALKEEPAHELGKGVKAPRASIG